MARRLLLLALALLAVVVLAFAWFLLQRRQAPRAAALLPPAQGAAYIDLGLLRKAGVFDRARPVQRDPEFAEFVRQTGFDFERDLDVAALALHSPATLGRGDNYPRFSWVFVGRFDPVRAAAYFGRLARTTELYRDKTVFLIPQEDRTVRVVLLDDHTAAVSNTETADTLRYIVDRWLAGAAGAPAQPLVAQYYEQVPVGSIAWFIGRVASPPGVQPASSGLTAPSWLRDVAGGSDVVASLRFVTDVQFRAVALAPGDAVAQRISQSANSWLSVFRALQTGTPSALTDKDVKAAFDSLRVTRQQNQVTLSADIPVGALKKLVAEPPVPTQTPAGQKEKGKGQK